MMKWARLWKNPTGPETYALFAEVQVLWDLHAIQDIIGAQFPGFTVTKAAYELSTAVGLHVGGRYELIMEPIDKGNKNLGTIFVELSKYLIWRTWDLSKKKSKELLPPYDDPMTAWLMKGALKTHGKDCCQACGWKDLHFRGTTLRCNRCLTNVGGC